MSMGGLKRERKRLQPMDWLFPSRGLKQQEKRLDRESRLINLLKDNPTLITAEKNERKNAFKQVFGNIEWHVPISLQWKIRKFRKAESREEREKIRDELRDKLLNSNENRKKYLKKLVEHRNKRNK